MQNATKINWHKHPSPPVLQVLCPQPQKTKGRMLVWWWEKTWESFPLEAEADTPSSVCHTQKHHFSPRSWPCPAYWNSCDRRNKVLQMLLETSSILKGEGMFLLSIFCQCKLQYKNTGCTVPGPQQTTWCKYDFSYELSSACLSITLALIENHCFYTHVYKACQNNNLNEYKVLLGN